MPKIIHINNIEVKGNKVSKIDSNSTNIEYPSAKAVYDMISSLEPSGGGTSDNNTLIEDPVNDWDTLYTVLMEYDKVFTTGGSVTVYTEGSLWGASGFYNIKRDLNTSYEFIATNIGNPIEGVYRLNTQDKTYEFIGSIPFGTKDSVIDRENLFSQEMIDKYLSLPVYTRGVAGDATDKFYNSLTDQGIYKIDSYSGAHEVLLVFKPESNAHLMQIKLSYDKFEYRSCWATSSVESPEIGDWTDWSLLNSLIDMGMITEIAGLLDKTYSSEVTYTFRSNGSWGLPTGNYMAKVAVNSDTILEVAPFIYRGKSYQINTDSDNWSITEVTPT